jgi:HEPN domain-containing protein
MNNNLQEGMRWLSQARFDLDAAHWLLEGEFWWEVCFKGQQASEKALKAYLYAQGKRAVLGHALLELGRACAQFDAGFDELRSAYRRLDRYYITARYPNGLPAGTPAEYFAEDEAQEALGLAEQIVALVDSHIQALPGVKRSDPAEAPQTK